MSKLFSRFGRCRQKSLWNNRRSEKIYSQGDPATSVMLRFKKGGAKALPLLMRGSAKKQSLAILGPGDFLGEGSMAGQFCSNGDSDRDLYTRNFTGY